MPYAGHGVQVRVAASDISGDVVGGSTSIDWNEVRELLETTAFGDSNRLRDVAGLADLTVSLSGDFEPSDTGQALLKSSRASGADVFLRFLYDGSSGYKCAFKVASFNISASFDGKLEYSCDLEANGSAGTVTP
jgi:predicted secreted protein